MHHRHLPLILTLTLLLVTPSWQVQSVAQQDAGAAWSMTALPAKVQTIPGTTVSWWAAVQQEISADILPNTPEWTDLGEKPNEYFGYSVATAGDVNHDGYSDVIVGAHNYNGGQTSEGRAYVYHGSPSGLSTTADWFMEIDMISAEFGWAVGTAGDVNGDGYSDVIIGARRYSNGETYEGGAFVYHGSATGLSTTANWSAEGDQENVWFGFSVGTAGDVNDDGYSDVIVGVSNPTSAPECASKVHVYHGSETGLSASADWTEEFAPASACFGYSVATAGDVNKDGYSDVIIGAPYYDNEQEDEGAAFVYYGSASGLSTTADWSTESDQASAYFGVSVGTAGDVNGDGYADVIIGAPWFDNDQDDEGSAFVYHGSGTGLSTVANWSAESDQEGANFGISVGTAGYVNDDAYSEVLIGADRYSNGHNWEGRASLYAGSATGLSTTADWFTEGDQAYAYYGFSLGTAGDVNGSGFSDVIVGAFGYYYDYDYQGQAYVYQDLIELKHVFLPLVLATTP